MRCSFSFWTKTRNTEKVSTVAETESWELRWGGHRGQAKRVSPREGKRERPHHGEVAASTRQTHSVKTPGAEMTIWKGALHFRPIQPMRGAPPRREQGKHHPGDSHWLSSGSIWLPRLGRAPRCCHSAGPFLKLFQQHWRTEMALQPAGRAAAWRGSQWYCSICGYAQPVASGHLLCWEVTSWRGKSARDGLGEWFKLRWSGKVPLRRQSLGKDQKEMRTRSYGYLKEGGYMERDQHVMSGMMQIPKEQRGGQRGWELGGAEVRERRRWVTEGLLGHWRALASTWGRWKKPQEHHGAG